MSSPEQSLAADAAPSTTDRFTIETIHSWHAREDRNHYNCGRNIIQIGFVIDECTRLKRYDRKYYGPEAQKRFKKNLPIEERTWYVDGTPCASLEEAIERLNNPVEFTEYELEILAQIPTELTDIRELRCKIAGIEPGDTGWTHGSDSPLSKVTTAMLMLAAKGATEYGRLPMPVEDEEPGRRTVAAIRKKSST
jgi:hypothetical protein